MASVSASLISRRSEFRGGDFSGSLSKIADARNGFIDFFLPQVRLGHDPRYGPAMTSDNERLAALHVVKQLGQMGFRLGGLNLAHNFDQSI
jgi:hypothetical protein